jgi:hypothetical protein
MARSAASIYLIRYHAGPISPNHVDFRRIVKFEATDVLLSAASTSTRRPPEKASNVSEVLSHAGHSTLPSETK